MARHLAGKVARLIGDFRTIHSIVDLIDHELEKRMVARHGWVKLDSLADLLPRLKNEIRTALPPQRKHEVGQLEVLIRRLSNDVTAGPIAEVRDAMSAHGLKLDLDKIATAWELMSTTTFGVLEAELGEIDIELGRLRGANHIAAGSAQTDPSWTEIWGDEAYLGDPSVPRAMTVYPVLGAGVVGPLPGGHPAQDALIRAMGIANFMMQGRVLLQATPKGSGAERLLLEMIVNDLLALWEVLFTSGVRNDYGPADQSLLSYWQDASSGWLGSDCLEALRDSPHPKLQEWREDIRNKISAHVDAEIDVWDIDLSRWPMTVDEVTNECVRVYNNLWQCCQKDIRNRAVVFYPIKLKNVIKLSGQEGRGWAEN